VARYILGRLAGLVFVLVAVSMVAFFLMRAVPGDPFATGERRLPEATQQARLAKYGLDRPLWEQYLRYVGNALRGDFGVPFQSPTQTVAGLIAETWPVTIRIGLLTIASAYALAPTALVARYTRAGLLETLGADHVRTARAKGLRERRVLGWHVARNALIPRLAMFQEAEKILVEDVPAVFVYYRTPIQLVKPYVKGDALAPDENGIAAIHWPGYTTMSTVPEGIYIGEEAPPDRS